MSRLRLSSGLAALALVALLAAALPVAAGATGSELHAPHLLDPNAGSAATAAVGPAGVAAADIRGAFASGGTLRCAYVEAGRPGPAGNRLRIEDGTTHFTDIYVHHGDVLVAGSKHRGAPADCEGAQATVVNIDRIEYTAAVAAAEINAGGDAPLAPGATPEAEGSEIEVSVHEEYTPQRLRVAGTAGPDTIEVGQRGPETVDVNLDARADGGSPDPDVTLVPFYGPSGTTPRVRITGRGGDDTISARGDGAATPVLEPYGLNGLVLRGGPGDDRLTGGRGKDRLAGGPGNDRVEVADRRRGDRVNCGRGRRDRAVIDRADRTRGCELVSIPPR